MVWNPRVNLLVLKWVGGLSAVFIRFRMDGTVEPLRSCKGEGRGGQGRGESEGREESKICTPVKLLLFMFTFSNRLQYRD